MSSATPQPRYGAPSSKAAHKHKIFELIQQIYSTSLAYTMMQEEAPQGVHEQDFMDWVEDVLLSLPSNEDSIPQAMVLMVQKIMKRSNECEIRIVEYVDASRVTPTPVIAKHSDGACIPVEQVIVKDLDRLLPHVKYEFGGNTGRFLPTTKPMVLTFTPDPPKSSLNPAEPPMSFELLTSGKIVEREVPYCPAKQDLPSRAREPPPRSSIVHPSAAFKSSGVQTDAVKPSFDGQTFRFTAPANIKSLPARGNNVQRASVVSEGILPADIPSPSPSTQKQRKQKKSKVAAGGSTTNASIDLIPFPTMGPPATPTNNPSTKPLIIVVPKLSTTKKPLRQSARETRSRTSNASASSSKAVASPSVQSTTKSASLKKGKKRAREDAEETEMETTRPARRLRSDSAKSDSRLSNKVSGMKNAVLKFATGVFSK